MNSALEKLYSKRTFGIKPGLIVISKLMEELGNPQEKLRSIHVAGTNGKGSVTAMLMSSLRELGLKVGVYTSPHLVRVNERFSINGEEISDSEFFSLLDRVEQASQILLDSVIRLLPGVLGNNESLEDESFENCLLEYPQYTRPIEWNGKKVPDILLSGHHKKIQDWRKQQAIDTTKQKRPDLFKIYLDSKNS
jgi:tRNA (guanine-N1)-methyltransferase